MSLPCIIILCRPVLSIENGGNDQAYKFLQIVASIGLINVMLSVITIIDVVMITLFDGAEV